jgi:hypothetical protein
VAANARTHSKVTRGETAEINKASTKKTLIGQTGLNYYKKAESGGIKKDHTVEDSREQSKANQHDSKRHERIRQLQRKHSIEDKYMQD